jgi:integrase
MTVSCLSDSVVQLLECPPERKHWEVFDTLIKGLYVDVLPNGRMAYRLRYFVGKLKKILTLGNARVITVEEARVAARTKLRLIYSGANPQAVLLPGAGPTVEDFFLNQYLPFVRTYKRSWFTDESVIRNHILPILGPRLMGELVPADIARLVEAMLAKSYAPGTINRFLVLFRYAFTLAIKWKTEGILNNPVQELKNLKDEHLMERFLTEKETEVLMHAVQGSDNVMLPFIVPFLIYTGARKREVLDAKWDEIDWVQRSWRIPRTKSGKVRHVPLSSGALALLHKLQAEKGLPSAPGDWIFLNPETMKPFVSIFYSWDRARKLAGLPELRMHDLRHSFASFLINAGRSLYEVQELLGHADLRTTSRYAHLSRERLFDAVEVIHLAPQD